MVLVSVIAEVGEGADSPLCSPDGGEPHHRRAVELAVAMQRSMVGLNEGWHELGLGEDLRIRMGINTGMLIFGSQGCMTYTAIGLQTNVTARIQAQCQPGEILLSDANWQFIREEVHCTPKGEIEVKGVQLSVRSRFNDQKESTSQTVAASSAQA